MDEYYWTDVRESQGSVYSSGLLEFCFDFHAIVNSQNFTTIHCVPGSFKWMVKMVLKLLVWIFILSCLS